MLGKKVVIGVIYRPPDLDSDVSVSIMWEILIAARNKNVCIMGNSNYRNIDWDIFIENRESEEFLEVIQDCFKKQLNIGLTK